MRRLGAAVVSALALVALTAVPAQAQVDVLDLPPLGFEISRDAGFPGDVVTGQVDTDDVAEYCLDVDGLVGNVNFEADNSLPTWIDDGPPEGFDAEDVDTYVAAIETLQAGILIQPSTAQQLWLETFVFTFADIATQELLGDTGNFDPATGHGSIVVPPLEPNTYALAAACVEIMPAEQLIEFGLTDGLIAFWDYVEDNNIEVPPVDPFDAEGPWAAFVEESALAWVPELIQPRAVGIQLFCILNPDGTCGDETVIVDPPLETDPPAEPLESAPAPATVVTAGPSFTG